MGEDEQSKGNTFSSDLFKLPGMLFNLDIKDSRDRIQAYIDTYWNEEDGVKGIEHTLMRKHLRVTDAGLSSDGTTASATFEMTTPREYCSRTGNLHGGAVAMIMDMCTSMCAAPLARNGFWEFGGVSRVLSVTYLRPVPLGTELVIECEVLQIGMRLATVRGRIVEKNGRRRVLAVVEHNKASVSVALGKKEKL